MVLDNLPAHEVAGIGGAITARATRVFHLPSYNPDMNPIEMAAAEHPVLRGRLTGSGHLPAGCLEFPVPMTQGQMGQLLGLSNVHVNRTLKGFRERGVVELRGRTLRVLDLAALERVAAQVRDPAASDAA